MAVLYQLVNPEPGDDHQCEPFAPDATFDPDVANQWVAAGREVWYRHYLEEWCDWGSEIKRHSSPGGLVTPEEVAAAQRARDRRIARDIQD